MDSWSVSAAREALATGYAMSRSMRSVLTKRVAAALRAERKKVAARCAEICETEEILLPIELLGGTKREYGAALAVELGRMIRTEYPEAS